MVLQQINMHKDLNIVPGWRAFHCHSATEHTMFILFMVCACLLDFVIMFHLLSVMILSHLGHGSCTLVEDNWISLSSLRCFGHVSSLLTFGWESQDLNL